MTSQWWKNPIIIIPAIVAIVVAIAGAVIPIFLSQEARAVNAEFIGVQEASLGQSVEIVGKNLDLVAEVLLTQEIDTRYRIPFIKANDSKLIMTIPSEVPGGVYLLEFKTRNGDDIPTDKALTVVGEALVVIPPTPPRTQPTSTSLPASTKMPTPLPTQSVEPTERPTVEATNTPTSAPANTPIPAFQVQITEPSNGTTIPLSITIQGTTNVPVPSGSHLWVVVQFGPEWWPQSARINPFPSGEGYGWLTPALVGGGPGDTGKQFGILAITVPPSVDQEFQDWFTEGARTGNFPGFIASELLSNGAELRAGIAVTRN